MEELNSNLYYVNDNANYNNDNEDNNNKNDFFYNENEDNNDNDNDNDNNNQNDFYNNDNNDNNYNENINDNNENKLDKNDKEKTPIDNSIINLLLEIPFIKILPSYTIQDICHALSSKNYQKSEIVLRQGDPISNIYIIKKGSFKVCINYCSSINISQDINSFIKYQNITNEPFLEERKYELEGKLTNHQQLPLFIYQRNQFLGDLELVTGKKESNFTIQANEDNSVLYFMDRLEWVKLTKRIRIPFTKVTIDKSNRIQSRILDILERKNKSNIDKIKLCKDKINYQIEINDNYDSCVKKIIKKEKKLEKEKEKDIKKFKNKGIYMKLYPKEKELQQFQNKKNNILNIFKYPNILKDETKIYLKKNLKNNKRDIRKVKINQSKYYFNIEPHINKSNISSNENISKNLELAKFKSRLFLTNSIKLKNKNNSMNNIFNSTISPEKTKIKNNLSSTIYAYNSGSKNKSIYNNSSQIDNNVTIFKETKDKYYHNLIIQNILNRNINSNPLNSSLNNYNYNLQKNMGNKKVFIRPVKNHRTIKKSFNNIVVNKREKMDLDIINSILQERYNKTKNKLIEKLLGKKMDNS